MSEVHLPTCLILPQANPLGLDHHTTLMNHHMVTADRGLRGEPVCHHWRWLMSCNGREDSALRVVLVPVLEEAAALVLWVTETSGVL